MVCKRLATSQDLDYMKSSLAERQAARTTLNQERPQDDAGAPLAVPPLSCWCLDAFGAMMGTRECSSSVLTDHTRTQETHQSVVVKPPSCACRLGLRPKCHPTQKHWYHVLRPPKNVVQSDTINVKRWSRNKRQTDTHVFGSRLRLHLELVAIHFCCTSSLPFSSSQQELRPLLSTSHPQKTWTTT